MRLSALQVTCILLAVALFITAFMLERAQRQVTDQIVMEVQVVDGRYSYLIKNSAGKSLASVACAPSLQPPTAANVEYRF